MIELLFSWRISVTTNPEDITQEDREILMNFREVYERERTNLLQQGLQQERRQVVENMLRVRFGSLDEELSSIVEPMLQLPPEEYTRFCIELSREELLARFRR
ncbi:MAG: hypothetical protein SAK29_13345 [Scytonema sp. PMC 1069.18]|nr:hypothetical protein [Scytonema sp. PMC 1069.18]MEC4884969.1 hypothetical protein [Scytonema sp. PMC 1070.18]